MSLKDTVDWFNKTEGRDKITKVIQYGSRLIMYNLQKNKNEELANKFKALFQVARDSRKIFRLGKTLNEIQTILTSINKGDQGNIIAYFIGILQRAWFALYWVFDNIQILSTIKFINGDPKKAAKIAATFWLLALLTGLLDSLRILRVNQIKQQNLTKYLFVKRRLIQSGTNISDNKLRSEALVKVNQAQYINLIKIFGDLLPAGQVSEVIPKLFKKNLHDGWIGFGGLIKIIERIRDLESRKLILSGKIFVYLHFYYYNIAVDNFLNSQYFHKNYITQCETLKGLILHFGTTKPMSCHYYVIIRTQKYGLQHIFKKGYQVRSSKLISQKIDGGPCYSML
ncbi:hypothetical protein pb186bvf_016685 [Paramecium bursaria]